MALTDTGNVFERIYNGMVALCSDGELAKRLERVVTAIAPLRVDDFPEPLRNDFVAVKEAVVAGRQPEATGQDRLLIVTDYVRLYTKAARLDGTLQDIVADLSPD
jgi:hypothetical protein